MYDLITRDVRQFIREHGRYRLCKLYELIKNNEDFTIISDLLDISKEEILHWRTIFEMIGDSPLLSNISPPPPPSEPTLEVITNPTEPAETSPSKQPYLFII